MANFFKKGLKWLGRSNPASFAGMSLLTRSDKPRDLGGSLVKSAAAGASISGLGGFGGAALKYGPAIYGALTAGGGDKPIDYEALLRGDYPTGKNTPEDITAAEATKTRLRRGVSDTAAQRRQLVLRNAARRGTLGSGATETGLLRVGQDEALGAERAGAVGEEQLASMRIGREAFEKQKALTIIGGKLRDASSARYNKTLRQTAFLNSLLELTRGSLSALGNNGMETAVAGAGVNMDTFGDFGEE